MFDNDEWQDQLTSYPCKAEYGMDLANMEAKFKKVALYKNLIESETDVFNITTHLITAIQNIHFQGDALGKLLAHILIGKKIRVSKPDESTVNTKRFYIYQLLEALKRDDHYYPMGRIPHNAKKHKKLYTEMVKSWDEFFKSPIWILVSFITNEEKHNRNFEGELDDDKNVNVYVLTAKTTRTVSQDELDSTVEDFLQRGLPIPNRRQFEQNVVSVLQKLHKINVQTVTQWQDKFLSLYNENMNKLLEYKIELDDMKEE